MFIATQLNSTELNSTAWTTVDSVCRSWRHKQKHDWLGCTVRCSTGSVEFSWVKLSCVAINTPLLDRKSPSLFKKQYSKTLNYLVTWKYCNSTGVESRRPNRRSAAEHGQSRRFALPVMVFFSCVNFAWSGRHLRQKRPRHPSTHLSVAASTTATIYCTVSLTVCRRSFRRSRIRRHVLWPVPGSLTT